jgi:hypothetical protein
LRPGTARPSTAIRAITGATLGGLLGRSTDRSARQARGGSIPVYERYPQ